MCIGKLAKALQYLNANRNGAGNGMGRKENGTYIRAAGTSGPADEAILKYLEYHRADDSRTL